VKWKHPDVLVTHCFFSSQNVTSRPNSCVDEGWVPKSGAYTTGATRTETQRIFRCFVSVPEPIENEKLLNFSGDSALSAGYDSLSYLTLKAKACAVFDCVSPCGAHQRQAGCDGETGLLENVETNDDKSSPISTLMLIASLAFIKVGPQIIN